MMQFFGLQQLNYQRRPVQDRNWCCLCNFGEKKWEVVSPTLTLDRKREASRTAYKLMLRLLQYSYILQILKHFSSLIR